MNFSLKIFTFRKSGCGLRFLINPKCKFEIILLSSILRNLYCASKGRYSVPGTDWYTLDWKTN